MASDKTPKNDAPTQNIAVEDLAAAFAAGMQKALDQVKPKEFDYSEYLNRPENRDPALDLKRPVFQHGVPIQIRGCSQDTIDHLNELEPGEYIGGRVTVTLRGRAPHESIHIDYPFASMNDRMHNTTLFSSFSDLLQKINREQKAKVESK